MIKQEVATKPIHIMMNPFDTIGWQHVDRLKAQKIQH